MMFNILFSLINTQNLKHSNILNPTIKCFKLDYKYTDPLTKGSSLRSKSYFPGMHSDVSRESYSFELLDLPLDIPLVWKINQGYMAMDFFDLRCETGTCHSLCSHVTTIMLT